MSLYETSMIRISRDISDMFRRFWGRYERHISSSALVIGFIIDYLTLTRIDRFFDNIVLLSYLLIALIAIVFINFFYSDIRTQIAPDGTIRLRMLGWINTVAPIIMQFAFGGLFSGFVVFYSRSATLAMSWPFLFLLIGLLIGNEFFQRRYQRFTFQMGILYFALFSYFIFTVPIIVGAINTGVFILSGIISIISISIVLYILSYIVSFRVRWGVHPIFVIIFGIYIVINVLYFLNIIPPIPLSLQDARIAHSVERTGATYRIIAEPLAWYDYILPKRDVHLTGSLDQLYAYSSVFAPTEFQTDISHVWQYYNEQNDQWETRSRIPFSVIGGRDEGYRGYTFITNVHEGLWRVNITTDDNRLIGRMVFDVLHKGETTTTVIIK